MRSGSDTRPLPRRVTVGSLPVQGEPEPEGPPKAWTEWYRFARDELGYAHEERVEYANLRFVEDQNRETLRRREH
jgi:hypothetical protein